MKPILLSKTIKKAPARPDGIQIKWTEEIYFFGNVFFRKNRNSFLNKWIFYNGTVLHFLGFRFVKSIS